MRTFKTNIYNNKQKQKKITKMNSANNTQYKGLLNGPPTDNEDEDYPPQFTTLLHEQEKCIKKSKIM